MIIVPAFLSVLLLVLMYTFITPFTLSNKGVDIEDFFWLVREEAPAVEKAFASNKLKTIENNLETKRLSLLILKNHEKQYSFGNDIPYGILPKLEEGIVGTQMISVDAYNVYLWQYTASDGQTFSMILSGTQPDSAKFQKKRDTLYTALYAGIVIIVILSLIMTSRFLMKFVFRKIANPLDTLAAGVHQIRDGNLDYRIDYKENDEFLPVCNDFNEMAERLKTSVELTHRQEESRRILIAGISHDLRSPLTLIRGYVEGLLEGVARTPEKQHQYLVTIKEKEASIESMVTQLFQYSKMELDGFTADLQDVQLDEETAAAVQSCAEEFAAQGLDITLDTVPGTVQTDPLLYRRVLLNIIGNSLKYKTAERGHVQIEIQKTDSLCTVICSDDGPGVPEESVPKLFDVFYRTDSSRHDPAKGSGLGLAVAARAVQCMHGTISAHNVLPHGLAVKIELPLVKAPENHDEKSTDY